MIESFVIPFFVLMVVFRGYHNGSDTVLLSKVSLEEVREADGRYQNDVFCITRRNLWLFYYVQLPEGFASVSSKKTLSCTDVSRIVRHSGLASVSEGNLEPRHLQVPRGAHWLYSKS